MIWAILLVQTTLAASVFIPATSSLFQYDQEWKNATSDPTIMTATNSGSFYFLFRGFNFSIHFSPPYEGDMGLWFNGNQYVNLSDVYRTGNTRESSFKPGLAEYFVQGSDEDHQIHFSYTNTNASDVFGFGGLTIGTSGDTYIAPNMYGISATVAPLDRHIMDNTALNYSTGDWKLSRNASFAYGQTLASTNVVGASVSLTFTQDVSTLWLFGTLSREGATLNITFPSNNQITYLNNYGIRRSYLNDSLVQAILWSSGQMSVTPGSTMNITLAGGTFDLDYILYSTPSVKGKSWGLYITVIVIGALFTLFGLSGLIFWRWKRQKKRKKSRNVDRKGVLSGGIDEMPLRSPIDSSVAISQEDINFMQPPVAESVDPPTVALRTIGLPRVENPTTPSPAYESRPTGTHSSQSTHVTSSVATTPSVVATEQEVLPAWSPPPPSYLTVSELVSEARRGMIPLDQETLERLFERVMVLRREGRSSAAWINRPGGGLGFHANPTGDTIVEEEEVDELEALARRIAGIETMPSPMPLSTKR